MIFSFADNFNSLKPKFNMYFQCKMHDLLALEKSSVTTSFIMYLKISISISKTKGDFYLATLITYFGWLRDHLYIT